MKDFKTFVNENLLVPRNLEGRKDKLKQLNIRLLSQEVIDGNLYLDESFMDIDPKFVKLKKVNGYVWLTGGKWTEIPAWLKDVEIERDFNCSANKLKTLKNCPRHIGVSLLCFSNRLISLKGCPKEIRGLFNCEYNQLISLEGCPEIIGANYYCGHNKVKLELPENVKLKGKFINK